LSMGLENNLRFLVLSVYYYDLGFSYATLKVYNTSGIRHEKSH